MAGTRVLVADDELYNRLLVQAILEKWGISPMLVNNGSEALEAVQGNDFDLVLMDVRMPVMNGIEATKAIQQLPDKRKAKTPIIALTATTRQTEIEECTAAGMAQVLSKPFNESQLFTLITKILNHDDDADKNKTTEDTLALEKDKKYDLNDLKNLSNGDDAFVAEMVQVFINTTNAGIADMETALANEDWENLADYAHKIVPPCRHLQANSLLKKLKNIEMQIRDDNNTEGMAEMVADAKAEAALVIDLLKGELGEGQTINW